MLAGQDLGRTHIRDLHACRDDGVCGRRRHCGLARADVALEQARHGIFAAHVGDDGFYCTGLRFRGLEGEAFHEFADMVISGLDEEGRMRAIFGAVALAGELDHEDLFE